MVGYAVEATCDLEECEAKIDRGLAYVCGDEHEGGEHGCGGYFCYEHLEVGLGLPNQLCSACADAYCEAHRPIAAPADMRIES